MLDAGEMQVHLPLLVFVHQFERAASGFGALNDHPPTKNNVTTPGMQTNMLFTSKHYQIKHQRTIHKI
jgi:hypothetical protein